MVGIYSLGGQATIETPGKEELSVQIINRAIDLGINYIDTAAAGMEDRLQQLHRKRNGYGS